MRNILTMVLSAVIVIYGLAAGIQAKPIKLLFASWEPPTGFFVEGIKAFARELEKKTDGKVSVELSWAQALGQIPEYYDLTARGICDAGFCVPFHAKGLFSLSEITTLPFAFPSAEITTKALLELYKKNLLDKAFTQNVKLLFIAGASGNPLFTVDKPAVKLSDVRGLKIRSSGAQGNAIIQAMGAVPVFIPGAESYTSLQKKIVGGTIEGYGSISSWKTCEVLGYAIEPRMTSVTFAFFMNKNSYNRLPDGIKAVIDEMAKDNEYGLISARAYDVINENGKKCFIRHGRKVLQWEPATLKEIENKFAPIWKKWIADNEARGLPAKQAVDEFYYALGRLGVKKQAFGYTP